MLPYVNEFETENAKKFNNNKKGILQGKTGLNERETIRRERGLINSYVKFPCKASVITDRMGKVPKTLAKAIYIEYDRVLELFS